MNFSLNIPSVSELSKAQIESFGKGGFQEGRTLKMYFDVNEKGLEEAVQNLQKEQLWVDISCGQGNAIQEYIDLYPEGGHAIGITILEPPFMDEFIKADKKENRLHLYLGDFLTSPMEPLNSKVSLITDVLGVFQYSGQLNQTLKKVYDLLHCGGKAFVSFTFSPRYFTKVTIIDKWSGIAQDQSPEVVMLWLKTVKGFHFSEVELDRIENRGFVLERTEEPFHADPFYIKEYLKSDNRTVINKIFDCFRLQSLAVFEKKEKWSPSVKNLQYEYNFFWEVSEANSRCLEQAINAQSKKYK